jgi:signal transduction histidine kinase
MRISTKMKTLNKTILTTAEIEAESERQLLALDALSKLTNQFSKEPDFTQLIELLLWTISGQFSVANSFAIVQQPGCADTSSLFFATGKYQNNRTLQNLELTGDHQDFFIENPSVRKALELEMPGNLASFVFILGEIGVNLICPLVTNDRFLGLIGLGGRVSKKAFTRQDIELLSTLINTIKPFLANSYLFWEMAALKAWYVDILDSVDQGIFVFDENNRLKKVNSAGFLMLEEFKPYLINVNSLYRAPIELIFTDDIFHGWTKKILEARKLHTNILLENIVGRSEELEKIFNVRLTMSMNDSRSGKDIIITLDDITGQKESEQRMFNLEKMADKGVMASAIAHELNNFLGLILGGVELTRLNLEKGNLNKSAETIAKVIDNTVKMERFTKGLMNYGRLEVCKKLLDINEIIVDVLSFISVRKKYKKIRVQHELDKNIPHLHADADQLVQVLLNFLSNAADAINGAERKSGLIVVKTAFKDGYIELSIADNGTGIPDDVKPRLFETRFTSKETGHGYGLVTCGKIIKNHHGIIKVDSTLGKGTTFRILFKITDAH